MSQKNERIIPIQLEDESSNESVIQDSQETQELTESEKTLTRSLEQLSVEQMPKRPNVQIKNNNKNQEYLKEFDVMEKREGNPIFSEYSLPNSNSAERIIIVIDLAQDEHATPFTLGNNTKLTPLAMIKRAVTIFLTLKHNIDAHHEFAIVVLNENDAKLVLDFTSDMRKLKDIVNKITECVTEDIFDMSSLFEIFCNFHLPQPVAPALAPSYVLRAVIFWGRSYTMPKLNLTEEIRMYLEYPYFTCDILMTHEPIEASNNCNKIFETLQNLDKKGTAYFFPVCRDMRRMQKCCARLLAHPLQRPIQRLLKS